MNRCLDINELHKFFNAASWPQLHENGLLFLLQYVLLINYFNLLS